MVGHCHLLPIWCHVLPLMVGLLDARWHPRLHRLHGLPWLTESHQLCHARLHQIVRRHDSDELWQPIDLRTVER